MYLVNLLKECIGHIEKGEFNPVLNDAIIALRIYVDEKSRNIEVAVAASVTVTPMPSRTNKRKLQQTHNTNSKNSIEEIVIPYTQKDAISPLSSSSISNKRLKSTNHIETISPSSSLPQSQFLESEDVSWNQRLSEMKSYIRRNKGKLDLDIDKMGPELFIWTYTQSTMYKSNLLSESRKSELAQIDEFVMFSNAESGGFDTFNNEVNNDIDMNHQSVNQELQVNNTLQPLKASIEIEEPEHEDNNTSTTNVKSNSKDTGKTKQRGGTKWNKNLLKLKAYLKGHNTLESMSSKMDKRLYGWVKSQKSLYRNTVEGKKNKPKLSQERMEQLNQIKEFVEYCNTDHKERNNAKWIKMLEDLKAYLYHENKTNEKDTMEINRYKMGVTLYSWVINQRNLYANTVEGRKSHQTLPQWKMDKLNEVKLFVECCNDPEYRKGRM